MEDAFLPHVELQIDILRVNLAQVVPDSRKFSLTTTTLAAPLQEYQGSPQANGRY